MERVIQGLLRFQFGFIAFPQKMRKNNPFHSSKNGISSLKDTCRQVLELLNQKCYFCRVNTDRAMEVILLISSYDFQQVAQRLRAHCSPLPIFQNSYKLFIISFIYTCWVFLRKDQITHMVLHPGSRSVRMPCGME